MKFRIAGFGPTEIPFHMFDVAREAEEARRAVKLANLYHKGQDLAWDGRKVLRTLIAKHGGIHLPPADRDALMRIFAIIMWGELAAWKISTQLADRLVPLEAKMAATSQAHDEARHFYVMYDYLSELGHVPRTIDRPSRAVLDLVLNTDDLIKKLVGMQLTVETLALTIFQTMRETRVEPVLCDLLMYYEKDEARHVGLGIQYLPAVLREQSRWRAIDGVVFQLRIVAWTLAGLKVLEPDLRRLGIDPRKVLFLGKSKQLTANEMLWNEIGLNRPASSEAIDAGVDALSELMFPPQDQPGGWWTRIAKARRVFKAGGFAVDPGALVPQEVAALDTKTARGRSKANLTLM
jgi:hypothetical protein